MHAALVANTLAEAEAAARRASLLAKAGTVPTPMLVESPKVDTLQESHAKPQGLATAAHKQHAKVEAPVALRKQSPAPAAPLAKSHRRTC